MGAPKKRTKKTHPLAGKSGEGPPIAPKGWKWRAGNRPTDMYFFAPGGKAYRSRKELSAYLKTLKENAPFPDEFCWNVTSEILSTVSNAPQLATPVQQVAAPEKEVAAPGKEDATPGKEDATPEKEVATPEKLPSPRSETVNSTAEETPNEPIEKAKGAGTKRPGKKGRRKKY